MAILGRASHESLHQVRSCPRRKVHTVSHAKILNARKAMSTDEWLHLYTACLRQSNSASDMLSEQFWASLADKVYFNYEQLLKGSTP